MSKYENIEVQLSGEDGNAFSILARVRKALRDGDAPESDVEQFTKDATSGDYDHLLETCFRWVKVL